MRFDHPALLSSVVACSLALPGACPAALHSTFFGPTAGPVYEGQTVTIRLALTSDSGDFLGASGTFSSDTSGGETHPSPSSSSINISGATDDGYATVAYYDDGLATIQASGTGTEAYYGIVYSYYTGGLFGHWVDVYGYTSRSASFSAFSSFPVLNIAPTLTGLTGNLSVGVNESFTFGASAFDPGVYDVLAFNWDLDGDGLYDDFTGVGGLTSFATAGLHTVGVRVSDGDGGFAYGSFTANVQDVSAAPTAEAPEPATLMMFGAGALCFAATAVRRRSR